MRKRELDGLRFLLAITVMLWHAQGYVGQIVNTEIYIFRGEIATVIFFMLSGFFVIYLKNVNHKISVFAFCSNKLKKIYPVYFLTVMYIAILYWGKRFLVANPKLLIRHLLLLQSWPLHNKAAAEFNGPAWYLSCLMCYWIVTPALLKCFQTKWFKRLIVVCYAAFFAECFLKVNWNGIWLAWPFIAYCVGMVLGDICNKDEFKRVNKKVSAVLTAMLFLAAEIACNLKWNEFVLYSVNIAFGTILILYICTYTDSGFHKILKSKIMSSGGALTMNMYLVHSPIMYSLDRINWIREKPCVWLLCAFSLTISISYLLKIVPSKGKNSTYKSVLFSKDN